MRTRTPLQHSACRLSIALPSAVSRLLGGLRLPPHRGLCNAPGFAATDAAAAPAPPAAPVTLRLAVAPGARCFASYLVRRHSGSSSHRSLRGLVVDAGAAPEGLLRLLHAILVRPEPEEGALSLKEIIVRVTGSDWSQVRWPTLYSLYKRVRLLCERASRALAAAAAQCGAHLHSVAHNSICTANNV